MRMLLIILLSLLTLPTLQATGKKPKVSVTFHLETEGNADNRLAFDYEVMNQKRVFSNSAILSEKDFVSFESFPADDGSYGIVFTIKPAPAKRFVNLLMQARGTYMVAQVNGRFVDIAMIDRPVADRQVVIWRGVTAAEIREADKLLPRTSELRKKEER